MTKDDFFDVLDQHVQEQHWFEKWSLRHPLTAYREQPERFWEFFHRLFPNVTREKMERMLKETDLTEHSKKA